jgi:hypothetical protein
MSKLLDLLNNTKPEKNQVIKQNPPNEKYAVPNTDELKYFVNPSTCNPTKTKKHKKNKNKKSKNKKSKECSKSSSSSSGSSTSSSYKCSTKDCTKDCTTTSKCSNTDCSSTINYCNLCAGKSGVCKICKDLITKNIVPASNNTYSLGSVDLVWKDIFVGPNSLHIGNAVVGATGTILTTGELIVNGNELINGNLTVTGTINGGSISGSTGSTGYTGYTGYTG